MIKIDIDFLKESVLKAADDSYSPYSNFRVGAVVVTGDGTFYKGSNIENRSFGATVCAERVALFKAINDGHKVIRAVAVYGADYDSFLPPCGICRQVISEFSKNCEIFMINKQGEVLIKTINELLPYDSLDDLKND